MSPTAGKKKPTPEMVHQHQPPFSSTHLGQHMAKSRKRQTHSLFTGKISCCSFPLPPLQPKNMRPSNPNTIPRRFKKRWAWAHQATFTLYLVSVSHQRSMALLQSCWHKVLPERGAAQVSRQTKIKKNKLYDTAHCLHSRARFSEGGVNSWCHNRS